MYYTHTTSSIDQRSSQLVLLNRKWRAKLLESRSVVLRGMYNKERSRDLRTVCVQICCEATELLHTRSTKRHLCGSLNLGVVGVVSDTFWWVVGLGRLDSQSAFIGSEAVVKQKEPLQCK